MRRLKRQKKKIDGDNSSFKFMVLCWIVAVSFPNTLFKLY